MEMNTSLKTSLEDKRQRYEKHTEFKSSRHFPDYAKATKIT